MRKLKKGIVVVLGVVLFQCILWSNWVQQAGIHTFYYREGIEITDTAQLTILNLELRKLLPKKQLKSNLKITTTLSQKPLNDYLQISDKYKEDLLTRLQSNYPEHRSFLDSLYKKGRLSNISIIVLNNQTGEIENCHFNYSEKALFAPNLENRATDLYGYILTFGKGKNLYDSFNVNPKAPAIFQRPGPIIISHSFTTTPGGSIMSHPYDYYPLSEWKALENKLDIELDFSGYHPGRFSGIQTSLFALVKTLAVIRNNGKRTPPVFIRRVKNSKNELVYSHAKSPAKKMLSEHVVQNMNALFKNYMTQGPGIRNYLGNGIIEDCFLLTGGSGEHKNWLIYANDSYTFGLLEYNVLQTREHDYFIERREKFKLSSMMKELLSGMHLNRVKGQNKKQIERFLEEPVETIVL